MKDIKKCATCGTATLSFDPPIEIAAGPSEACGEMKPGTYTGSEKGGIPTCMRPKHGADQKHAYFVEYIDRW